MKKLIAKYRNLPYEERLIVNTALTMIVSSVIAVGKFIIGLFSDIIMCVVGIFNALLLLAKLQCILGVKTNKRTFKQRNTVVSILLFVAGLIYIFYMGRALIMDVEMEEYSSFTSIMSAFIGFVEMGIAVFGLVKTKNKGHFYRDIKIINFTAAMTAIMTAQIALLSVSSSENTTIYNSFTGIGIGAVTVILAIYIYFAPDISIIDREHNVFILSVPAINKVVDMSQETIEISLCKSRIYGDYIYKATIKDNKIDGHIIKTKGFFKNLNIFVKIIFIVLSEILIFVWLFGYMIYFCRTVNMPKKLTVMMETNGFEKVNV